MPAQLKGRWSKRQDLERHIEQRFLHALKERWPTADQRKMNGYGNRSWPDRMILLPKVPAFFIEFKRPGEGPSPGQEQKIKELRALGKRVYICDDSEQAMVFCEAEVARANGYKKV